VLLAAEGTTLLSLQVTYMGVVLHMHGRCVAHAWGLSYTCMGFVLHLHCATAAPSPPTPTQPSDTLLDYSFFPVHLMMARHVGVQ